MAKKIKAEPQTYSIPYEVTLRGDLLIEAHSAAEAERIADAGGWEDDTFYDRASIGNWERHGPARFHV